MTAPTHPEVRLLTRGSSMRSAGLALTLLVAAAGPARLAAEDWPQFRGPNCTGVSTSTRPLPAAFSPKQNVRWVKTLGEGIGSPTVADGRVFSTAVVGEGAALKLVAYGFDAATGEQL